MENNYGVGLYNEGIFYFTNPGLAKFKDKFGNESSDFTTLWNNKEYTFKSKTTSPLLIPDTTPEQVQSIRKQFAKNYATKWFFTTKRYQELVKKGGYIPATYDEDTEYKDVAQACLTALPKSQMVVKDMPKVQESDFKGSKAIGKDENLENAFRDYNIPQLGIQ
jgi:hypothetical protein